MSNKQPIEIINHAGLCFADWLASARGAKDQEAGSIPVRSTNGANPHLSFSPFMNPLRRVVLFDSPPSKGN